MKFDIQRMRALTTGRLHAKVQYIYEDLEAIIGEQGLMTHMLPRVMEAVKPWLRQHITDSRFWEDAYDTSHVGEIEIPDPTDQDRAAMLERFKQMPNPLFGKDVYFIKQEKADG